MKREMRKKNKGFSLVELIVVIAIMGILAVTLAPKLSHYIDRARQTNDKETVNTIYTAVKLGLMEEDILAVALAVANPSSPLTLNANDATKLYQSSADGKTWTLNASIASGNLFLKQISEVVGNFKLQSNLTNGRAKILITVTDYNTFKVQLDYDTNDGHATNAADPLTYDYTVDSSSVSD